MYNMYDFNSYYDSSRKMPDQMQNQPMNPMPYQNQPYVHSDGNSGEISIAGIVNVKYEFTDDGTFYVSANIANLFDIGSFTLNTQHPMINFTQGNSFYGYSLTFGIDYNKKEFYMSGYVKIPFISPFETGRFVIYSWS